MPVLKVATKAGGNSEVKDKKTKRKREDMEPEEIKPASVEVLGYLNNEKKYNNNIILLTYYDYLHKKRIQITPVFSPNELKVVADSLREAMPYAQSLFEVAKHLLLAVCYKMVLTSKEEPYIILPKSDNAKSLFARLKGAQIVTESGDGMFTIMHYYSLLLIILINFLNERVRVGEWNSNEHCDSPGVLSRVGCACEFCLLSKR